MDAELVSESYRENEAWTAMTNQIDPIEVRESNSWISVLAASFPGTMLVIALLGGHVWGLSKLMDRVEWARRWAEPPIAPVLGVICAVAVFMMTKIALAV